MGDVVHVAALLVPPYGLGVLLRTLSDRNRHLTEHAAALARTQEAVRQEAVAAP